MTTMIKTFLYISLICFPLLQVNAQENDEKVETREAVDYMTIPGPLTYDGEEYFLAWSKKNSATWFQQQYIKKDDDFNKFQDLINISFFNKEIALDDAARMKVESIEKRKEAVKDDYSFVDVIESPDGNEIIVDYLVTIVPKEGDPYAEYNMDRFKNVKKDNINTLVIFSVSKRIYGDLKSGAKFINKNRNKFLDSVISTPIPTITLK